MIRNQSLSQYSLRMRVPATVWAGVVFVLIIGTTILITTLWPAAITTISQAGSNTSAASAPTISIVFTPEVQHWSPLILAWQSIYGVDADLIATLIQIESCGYAKAVSPSGALGLFQVMPFHFVQGEDGLDIATNGQRGMEYLAKGLQMSGGDVGLALAGYNGGHGIISRPPETWADETRRYYLWGLGIYQEAKAGLQESPTLQNWLNAGGTNLCRMARSYQELS